MESARLCSDRLAWIEFFLYAWKYAVKTTQYFRHTRERPDRAMIKDEWIEYVIRNPLKEVHQMDGRIRRWARIREMDNRVLRVILLEDGETVHNAFFDRSFKE